MRQGASAAYHRLACVIEFCPSPVRQSLEAAYLVTGKWKAFGPERTAVAILAAVVTFLLVGRVLGFAVKWAQDAGWQMNPSLRIVVGLCVLLIPFGAALAVG